MQYHGATQGLSKPVYREDGILLSDSEQTWSWLTLLGESLSLSIFYVIFLNVFTHHLLGVLNSTEPGLGQFALLAFFSFLVLIAICAVAWGTHQAWIRARLQPGELILSAYPLRLGESYQLRYRRRLRRGTISRPGNLSGKWRCYKWVRYYDGRQFVTRTQTLSETELALIVIQPPATRFEYAAEIEIMSDRPPSYDIGDHQVRWELQVCLDLPGIAKDTSHFRLKVLPGRRF
ncbi:MAG: hypothetical protein AAGF24_13520 [Cyanobacteria bacterium P01_H01_bin.121]